VVVNWVDEGRMCSSAHGGGARCGARRVTQLGLCMVSKLVGETSNEQKVMHRTASASLY
jgi:hypothetical protein